MTHRALLLGAAYGTLLHVPRSLELLEGALRRYDFQHIERHCDREPELLVAALERFIAGVEPADPVAIVYVGHAGRREGIGYLRPSPDPRSVVGLELGAQLAALVRKTQNVTLVLDCCHAAGVLEDPSHLDADALPRLVAAQRERTLRREVFRGDAPLDAVVQLFAAAASQNAIEDLDRQSGLFSSVLADVLDLCVGLEVGWHEILDEVRLRMRLVDRDQAPALGGRHRRRVPFTERDSRLRFDDLACTRSGSGFHLASGELGRVALRDRFALRALGQPPGDPAPTATVTELGPEHAWLDLDGDVALPDAVPLRAMKTQRLPGGSRSRLEALERAPRLPSHAFDLRWGRVAGRVLAHLPDEGARIGPNDGLWVAFGTRRNEYAFALFFSVFHIGPDDRLVHMSPAHPQGVLLPSEHHFLLATRLAHGLAWADTLEWPSAPPPGQHSLVILVSNKQITTESFSDHEREAMRGPLTPPSARYAMKRLVFTVL